MQNSGDITSFEQFGIQQDDAQRVIHLVDDPAFADQSVGGERKRSLFLRICNFYLDEGAGG